MENNKIRWRISECVCIIAKNLEGKETIYFTSPENKQYIQNTIKLVKTQYYTNFIEVWITESDKFKLKVTEDGELRVNNPNLPNPSGWYSIGNWIKGDRDRLQRFCYFLSYINIENSILEDEFSIIFSDDFPNVVDFISTHLPEYEKCYEEMERRFNISVGKKTTKWIPGKRYDTTDESYYYLGQVFSRINHRGIGGKENYVLDSDPSKITTSLGIYLENEPKNKDNIWEDVVISFDSHTDLKNNYIDVIIKKVSGVDCGLFTDPDKIFSDPKKWRLDIIKNTLEKVCKTKKTLSSGIEKDYYYNINLLLEPIYLYLGEKDEADLRKIGEYVNPILKPVILNAFETLVEDNFSDLSNSEMVGKLVTLFIRNFIVDIFYQKELFITNLFKKLGLDLNELAKEFIENLDISMYSKDWETYLKHVNFFEYNHKNSYVYVDLKVKSDPYHYKSKVDKSSYLKDSIPSDDLREEIKNIIKWSEENNRVGLKCFHTYKSNKNYLDDYVEVDFSLGDIINIYRLRGKEISENLKKTILTCKFVGINLQFDKSINWKKIL